jgi:hypothetical protein
MIKRTLLGVAAILSTAIATPVLAKVVLQEPGAYAFYRPNGDLGIAPTPSQRREVGAVGRGTADAMALATSFRASMAGRETTTRPWSAPVGHRQPPMSPHRRQSLSMSLIKKMRTSTARSEAFAEAAKHLKL